MTGLCGVCQQSHAKYTCPRCEIQYCSLPCYQRHGEKCTENFYQRQVQEELHSTKISGDERKRLEKIVSQLNHLDADEDEDDDDIGGEGAENRRFEELAAKAEREELDVGDLTEEEARSFHSQLKRGALGRLLSPWQPWWLSAGVVDMDPSPGAASSKSPPHICCAEGRKPHASVALASLSALYAHVHTLRAFNGEWMWAPLEAAPHLLHLCPGICSHQVHASVKECLRASIDAAAALPGRGYGSEFDLLCLSDLSAVIRGGAEMSTHAIQETVDIIDACLAGGGRGRSGKLRRGLKKLEFLSSFVFHHFELLQPLADAADSFAERHERELQQVGLEERQAQSAREHGGIVMPEMD